MEKLEEAPSPVGASFWLQANQFDQPCHVTQAKSSGQFARRSSSSADVSPDSAAVTIQVDDGPAPTFTLTAVQPDQIQIDWIRPPYYDFDDVVIACAQCGGDGR